MTNKEAKAQGFTHDGHMFGFIPVFVKFFYDAPSGEETFEVIGKNKILNLCLDIMTSIDLFLETGYSFELYLNTEEL